MNSENISGIFNTVYLENETDILNFDLVLLLEFFSILKETLYIVKIDRVVVSKDSGLSPYLINTHRFVYKFDLFVIKGCENRDSGNNTVSGEFTSLSRGFGGRISLELKDFDFVGYRDYEFLLTGEEMPEISIETVEGAVARRCIQVLKVR